MTIRIPVSMEDAVKNFVEAQGWQIPFYASKVAAGQPCWADDHEGDRINLAECLVRDPAKTLCVQAQGDSMIKAGIDPDDILVVDSGIEATNGQIVVVALDGDLTVKRLQKEKGRVFLKPENDNYQPIPIEEENSVHVWGVVTNIIKKAH